jgi:glutathione S-transferase
MPTVHGVNASPFVRKVRIALAEKGIAYELEPVMPYGQSDAFRAISPLGKIPVYQDGDFTLPDSSCIIAYLERIQPEPPLYPSDPKAYGRALFYEEYADTLLVDALTPIFFQRIVLAKVMKQSCDEGLVRRHIEDVMPPAFDWLEGEAPDGDGIVEDRFSVADLAIVSPFVNIEHAGVTVDASRWPRLAAYVARLYERPSIRALIDEEKAAFASM